MHERIALDTSRNRHIFDTSHHLVHKADVQHNGAPSCLKVHQPSGKLVADFIDWKNKGAKLVSYDAKTGVRIGEGEITGNRSCKSYGMVALNSTLDCVAFASGADTREKITLTPVDTLMPRSAAWSMPKARIIRRLGAKVIDIEFSPLDNFLVCKNGNYRKYILDISRSKHTEVTDGMWVDLKSGDPKHMDYVVGECFFSPDERFVAVIATYLVDEVHQNGVVAKLIKSAIHVHEIKRTSDGHCTAEFRFELAEPCTPTLQNTNVSMIDAKPFSWRPDGRCFAYVIRTGIEMCTICSDDSTVLNAPMRKTLLDYIQVGEAHTCFFPMINTTYKIHDIPSTLKELHLCIIGSICWSPDNTHMAFMNETWNAMCVVDTRTRKQLFCFPCYQHPHSQRLSIIWSPDGGQVTSLGLDDPKPGYYGAMVRTWAARDWSDRTHYLFGPELRRMVFRLMCIRDRLIKERDAAGTSIVPHLPMSLWLDIFLFLSLTQTTI